MTAAVWQEHDRVRDDDPYHAWAHRTAAGPEIGGLCPVVILARADDGTYHSLLRSLEYIRDQAAGGETPFSLSEYDREHLDASLKHAEAKQGAPIEDGMDYARMLLVYAEESRMFPRTNDIWTSKYFEVLFVGRTIRDPQVTERLSDKILGRTGPIPDVCLTIIDDSIAFLNDRFVVNAQVGGRRVPRSRFSDIWFQDRERPVAGGVRTGARLDGDEIDALLRRKAGETEAEIYASPITSRGFNFTALDWTSEAHQPLAFPLSHGTHVADTAVARFDALVPNRILGLNAVTIPTDVTEDTSGSAVGSYMIAALRQAMLWNDQYYQNTASPRAAVMGVDDAASDAGTENPEMEIPLVINFSYGFTAGPKDGSSALGRVIARMIDSRNALGRPTALVVPMGNTFHARGVARFDLAPGEEMSLDWVVQPDDHTPSFLELYAKAENAGGADYGITVTAPAATIADLHITTTQSDKAHVVHLDGCPVAEWGEWPCAHGGDWSRRAVLALGPTVQDNFTKGCAPAGRWQVRIENTSAQRLEMMLAIQRDDAPGTYPVKGRQSYLDHPEAWMMGDGAEHRSDDRSRTVGYEATGNRDQLGVNCPITHAWSGSTLASIDSEYVFVAGAGMGTSGEVAEQIPLDPSPYASQGPRRNGLGAPDFTALSDRSAFFTGIYASGTYSGTEFAMSGSSAAAPQIAAFLAAHPKWIKTGRSGLNALPHASSDRPVSRPNRMGRRVP